MTTTTVQTHDRLLRTALRGNGVFSSISGAIFVLAAAQVAGFLGVSPDAAVLIALIGAGLIGYAALLFWNAACQPVDLTLALGAVAGDVLWVLGSLAVLVFDPFGFTTAGRWATLIIADAVTVFAILQFVGLRRARSILAHPLTAERSVAK